MSNTSVATQERPPGPMVLLRRELDAMRDQFVAALPKQIPIERFCRVVMTAIQNNPDLLGADRRSLWNSAMRAAQDGLLPDGREGAMVMFGKKAQFLPMVAGLRKKVRNSGDLATWDVYAVHEHDVFEFALGDEPYIKHVPALDKPGKMIAVYSVATLKSGEKSRDVMSVSEVERIRLRSRAKDEGPWKTDYEEMAKKTVARRHSKVLPMSTDLDDLLRRDDDFTDVREEVKERQAASGASALDVFAQSEDEPPIDAETGEILPAPHARGRADREAGKALRACPPEWREGDHAAELDQWEMGWREADAEIAAKAKKQAMIFADLTALVPFAKLRAKRGTMNGTMTPAALRLMRTCMHFMRVDAERAANILFTRDTGHHTSGWWKNPDYERCFHLSISYTDISGINFIQHDKGKSEEIVRAFYGDEARNVWCEPPYSAEGKGAETWHYRLFCDEGWQPLKPRGEVYSKDWTPADWKSFSDVCAKP